MENAISVTQVNNYIKYMFEAETMLQNIFVHGEIGSYKITNGIAYFNLKDENSIISCVLFGANNFPLFDVGDQVVVRGSVSYYAKGGKLNFNAYSIEKFGIGLLYQQFLKLKEELELLGYFDESKKKPLPERVNRIGVVTSETGAVIRDIIDVTTRRNNSVDVVLYPVKVQGVGAEKEIAQGVNFFSNYDLVDVVIVARGGGSLEDLQPYNTKTVADAVFNCNKPVVSAVGHETDFTIVDFVSDLRAPTPSAAAELVVNKKDEDYKWLMDHLGMLESILVDKIDNILKDLRLCNEKITTKIDNKCNSLLNYLNKCFKIMSRNSVSKLELTEFNLKNKLNLLKGLNQESLASKGFVRIFNNNNLVKSINDVSTGDELSINLLDGKVVASVKDRRSN
ncbi:MAG: exodeoxyribonuclease VII large subunit [Clostridia bacterium]|nr:exodeoxyribonuclease VII large subunit [Clostridia bacterium]